MSTPAAQASPFVGLRPFRSEERLLFFGRRQQTVELLDRLHRTHFLSVVGSSGSGKSSLIRAGLIPNLEAGFLVEDRDRWVFATMTPGDAPLQNLAAAVSGAISTDPIGEHLYQEIANTGAQALADALTPVLDQRDANCLLLVDQFEELFRFGLHAAEAKRRDEATDFVSILLTLAEQRSAPVYVVLTMRSDFLGDCDAFHGLPEAMNRSQYLVPRLTRQQRREAVEGPIRLYGQSITPQLLDRVLNDVGDEPDQLPILQHALLRTWENWRLEGTGPLDLRHYEAVGTTKEALSRDADAALEGLGADDLKLAERVFQALTTTDAANRRIRRPAKLSELVAITGASRDRIRKIVDQFRGHGRSFLVVSDDLRTGDALIDISHESLIRQWKRLRDWVDQEAESRRVYLDIADAVVRRKALWHDPDLQVALDWRDRVQPNAPWAERYHPDFAGAMAFLDASREQRDREKRDKLKQQRIVRGLTAGLLVFSIIVAIVIVTLFRKARAADASAKASVSEAKIHAAAVVAEAKKLADDSLAAAKLSKEVADNDKKLAEQERAQSEVDHSRLMGLRLGTQALSKFDDHREALTRSALLAIESLKADPTNEGRRALAQALRLIPSPPKIIPDAHKGPVKSLAFSQDGRWMASGGNQDGQVILWDRSNQTRKLTLATQRPPIMALAFSQDGRWLAAGVNRAAMIWDTATGKLAVDPIGHENVVHSVWFSSDGSLLATYSPFGGMRMFQNNSGKWEERKGSPPTFGDERHSLELYRENFGRCNAVSLSWDQSRLAALCRNVLTITDFSPTAEPSLPERITGFQFSIGDSVAVRDDGKFVAATDNAGVIHVFGNAMYGNHPIGEETIRIETSAMPVAFTPDGKFVSAGIRDGSIGIWPLEKGSEAILVPSKGNIFALQFSPDEKWLVAAGDYGVHVFDLSNIQAIREVHSFEVPADSEVFRFSPDGRLLAAMDLRGALVFQTHPWKREPIGRMEGGTMMEFTPDNRLLLTSDGETIRRYNTATWKELTPALPAKGEFRISPDSRWLSTANEVYTVRHVKRNVLTQVWNLATGLEVAWRETGNEPPDKPRTRPISGGMLPLAAAAEHWKKLNDNEHSPDGKWTASVSGPRVQIDTGVLDHDKDVNIAMFSPQSRWLATFSQENKIRLWPLRVDDSIDQACKLLSRNLTAEEWKEFQMEGPYHKTCPNLPVIK